MTTSFQLPQVQDLEVFVGSATTVSIALGFNVSGVSLAASAGSISLPISITNAAAGEISILISSAAATALYFEKSWRLVMFSTSTEDPPSAQKTLRWGRVVVVTPQTISASSPLYHAVEMAAADEFTFQVNLGVNLAGKQLAANLFSTAGGLDAPQLPLGLPVTVISSSSGLINVTIDEHRSSALYGSGGSWVLSDVTAGAVLRAGPVKAYTEATASASPVPPAGVPPESPPSPTPPQLGSIFL